MKTRTPLLVVAVLLSTLFVTSRSHGAADPWWSEVQQRIAASEYEISWQEETSLPDVERAWQAPNRAQNLRAYFVDDGVRVVRRTEDVPTWEWGLSLIGYGRGGRLSPVGKPRLSPHANRMEYHRGAIVEWYVNGPDGLEHGFTLDTPPTEPGTVDGGARAAVGARGGAGVDAGVPYLALALEGTLSPVIDADGQSMDFRAPGGSTVLRYSELHVFDAVGRELPAWMEGFADAGVRGIRIVFDDRDAVYPVTVDPVATGASWSAEGDQAGAELGFSVATAGDVDGDGFSDVIVGAYLFDGGETDEGRVFVYRGSSAGLSAAADWIAESDQVDGRLGFSVATAGDVNGDGFSDVIAGAYYYENGEIDEGRAYVWHGSATGLSSSPDWSAESNQDQAYFGVSVATAGDVNGDGFSDVIVGAHLYDGDSTDEGRAYVYHGGAAGLAAGHAWSVTGGQAGARLGRAVATAGDVNGDSYVDVVVGAYLFNGGEVDEGRLWVYHGSSSGLSRDAVWTAEPDQVDARLGYSVGTAGDVNGDGYADIVAGAYRYDGSAPDAGRVFVYHGSFLGLSAGPASVIAGTQDGERLGIAVGTAGDVNGDGYADVIVGAHLHDGAQVDEGRALVYAGSPTGIGLRELWQMTGGATDMYFGRSVSTAGDVDGDGYADVVVGATGYDGGETDEGLALLYHGSVAGPAATAGWVLADTAQSNAGLGTSVSAAGDVNGDGYADVIVGADDFDGGQGNEGRASVFLGSASGMGFVPAWTALGGQTGAHLGISVATAGDVNGDGYADVIVGAEGYSGAVADAGRASIFLGSPTGPGQVADWSVEGDQALADFGGSVAGAGDVNGDGFDDVIVGAHRYSSGETNEGKAYVYHGSATGPSLVADWSAESDQAMADFAISVASAGDVNGDGYSDVALGARGFDNGSSTGRVYVYHGSPGGLKAVADWTSEPFTGDRFGESVSTAGDVNGDGFADLIVGDPFLGNFESGEGRAYVFHGGTTGLAPGAAWTVESDQVGAYLGGSVSGAGDVNGDGFADVIVGAYGYDTVEGDVGRVLLFQGSAAGLGPVADWTADGPEEFCRFGQSVSGAGDVNGDGYADLLVGSPQFDGVGNNSGRVDLFYGNDGPGLGLRPQQRRADDLAPIVTGGRSRESGRFGLAARARTPYGTGRVQLEWEVEPLGQTFDAAGTERTGWITAGVVGTTVDALVSDLEPGAYHWRMRLHYDPVTTPFQQASRWFTAPWNGWEERDVTVSPFVGGCVWDDDDADGIRDAGEPPLVGVVARLLDTSGQLLQTTVSGVDGRYRFEVSPGRRVAVRFEVPAGWILSPQDQGVDDTVDSDPDTGTGQTGTIAAPFDSTDETRWSAGLRRAELCSTPDEPVYIYAMTVTADGNVYPVLHFQDPNQPGAVTGYNVYRSSDPALPSQQWPAIADDVIDMDESAPNKQWVDTTGDVSPSGVWYYQVAALNHVCPAGAAEGPW